MTLFISWREGEKIPAEIHKNIQTIDNDELKTYPSYNQWQVLGPIFRSERKDIFVNKELLQTHFKISIKKFF